MCAARLGLADNLNSAHLATLDFWFLKQDYIYPGTIISQTPNESIDACSSVEYSRNFVFINESPLLVSLAVLSPGDLRYIALEVHA